MSTILPESEDRRKEYYPVLDKLFSKSFKSSSFDALCSVLRVGGMSDANWDPFEESRKAFEDFNWILRKSIEERSEHCTRRIGLLMYCQAVEMTAVHEILANLLRCMLKQPYVINPFEHLKKKRKKKLFPWIPPSTTSKFKTIKELAAEAKETELVTKIDSFFDERIRNAFSHSDYILTNEGFRYTEGGLAQEVPLDEIDAKFSACFGFYGAFLTLHKHWLHYIGKTKKFHKWPSHEVFELLSSEEEGAYGFNVHFSNGSKATYTRRSIGVETINLSFGPDGTITFMVGIANNLEPIWKINGQPVEDWNSLP